MDLFEVYDLDGSIIQCYLQSNDKYKNSLHSKTFHAIIGTKRVHA